MRDAFVRALMREAARDPRLTLITGDLGFGVGLEEVAAAVQKAIANLLQEAE